MNCSVFSTNNKHENERNHANNDFRYIFVYKEINFCFRRNIR